MIIKMTKRYQIVEYIDSFGQRRRAKVTHKNNKTKWDRPA